jgi:hypothetical protein
MMLLVALFAPPILLGGFGRIRALPLAVWTLVASAILAWFAWHNAKAGIWNGVYDANRIEPAFQVVFFSAVFVFVGHHLVGPADEAKKLVAPYASYFDWAWKDAVQVALSLAFVGVLWASLELGAELFSLIGIKALKDGLHQGWIAGPLTGVGFAAGVQLTDVRVALIRGVRMVGLVLLSWLLPVMTALIVAFLAALPLTGLAPLFGTRSGAGTVLSASAALIVLTSAAYQDGAAKVPVVLRWSGRAAGLALVPLTLIAADAIWQRVAQYGLTPSRIASIAIWLVAAGFAVGYALGAARRQGAWMKPLEFTNVVMARVVMLMILVIFTPIADPARLSVDDQVGRLLAGKIAPEKFDFDFLTYKSGRYGSDALVRLSALKGSPRSLQIASLAQVAKAAQNPTAPALPQTLAQRVTVYPTGQTLPPSFLAQDWSSQPEYQSCFTNIDPLSHCQAFLVDIDGDGVAEVLLTTQTGDAGVNLDAFKLTGGAWKRIGELDVACADQVAALRAGQVNLARQKGVDVMLAGRAARFEAPLAEDCPPAKSP